MDEFPSNSHRSREEPTKADEKNIQAVTTGEVIRRKPPLGKRLLHTFVGGEPRTVAQYIFLEVLLPAVKDTVADMVSQGIERMLFGEARSTNRRSGYRPAGSTYTSYNRISAANNTVPWRQREESRPISRQSRARHDFDEIILSTRVEADEVLDRMFAILEKYEVVTVGDLYDLVGTTGNYTDEKWGWRSLQGAGITRISQGYLLDLPKPEVIN